MVECIIVSTAQRQVHLSWLQAAEAKCMQYRTGYAHAAARLRRRGAALSSINCESRRLCDELKAAQDKSEQHTSLLCYMDPRPRLELSWDLHAAGGAAQHSLPLLLAVAVKTGQISDPSQVDAPTGSYSIITTVDNCRCSMQFLWCRHFCKTAVLLKSGSAALKPSHLILTVPKAWLHPSCIREYAD